MEDVNEKNAAYLDKQLFNTGFGEEDPAKLRELMAQGKERFEYPLKIDYGSDTANVVRNFALSDKGNYFFNTYSVSVEREGADPVKQLFYVRRPEKVISQKDGMEPKEWINSTITMKEAYNLLKGRPVLKDYLTKDGEHYKAWTHLDFKKTDKHGNYLVEKEPYFDIKDQIASLPIKDIDKDGVLDKIVDSIHKGNRQSVQMVADNGVEVEMFIGTNLKAESYSVFSKYNVRPNDWKAYIEKASLEVKTEAGGQDLTKDKSVSVKTSDVSNTNQSPVADNKESEKKIEQGAKRNQQQSASAGNDDVTGKRRSRKKGVKQ
ncbi:hypothetical protein [Pedobacter frigoris]|uniref:hypothetical protein n=1 Tax=Pedobacter frigoris TaxID=2571272 RepID=UPI00292FFBE2|nr:hypothetical protein [Pedobacter frigoris]